MAVCAVAIDRRLQLRAAQFTRRFLRISTGVEHPCDVWMIHQRQSLPLNRLHLLRQMDDTESTLSEFLEKLVAADMLSFHQVPGLNFHQIRLVLFFRCRFRGCFQRFQRVFQQASGH